MGVPLIVAATDIDKYYFNDAQVMFFPPENDEALAAAMLTLIENPDLRESLVKNGLACAATNDWERKKSLYLDIVSSLATQTDQAVAQAVAQ